MSESPTKPLDWEPVPAPAPITLTGRTVTLEPLDADRHTAALWQAVQGHDDLWTYLGDGPYPTEHALHDALAQKQAQKQTQAHGPPSAIFLAIVPKAADLGSADPDAGYVRGPSVATSKPQAAGYASFMRIDAPNGVVEVGNILLSPTLQRTTAATEAMYLMARHVFEDLGYRRYEWKCNANNHPSRRAALRLGFTFEGIFRQHMVVKGQNRDTAWFSILDYEWFARRHAFESWLAPANFDAAGKQRSPLSH